MSYNILSLLSKTVKSIPIQNICSSPSYGTWALSRFAHLNAGRVQPVLEVDKVIARQAEYLKSFELRKLKIKPEIEKVAELYEAAKKFKDERKQAEIERDQNSVKVQTLLKSLHDDDLNTDEIKTLRENGKRLREELRRCVGKFNHVNDELVDLILSLPNRLDPSTPETDYEVLRSICPPEGVTHWKRPANLNWDRIPGTGPYDEFAAGNAVWVELELAAKCQQFLLEQEFAETGNVDFVKRILLEGSGMDPGQFLRVREQKIQGGGISHATYLVGGATFPAFLALFAQSIIQNEHILPIKYFVVGRTYNKRPNGPGTIQTSAVQAFVACRDEKEQEEEFVQMAELMENFYSKNIGLTFQSRRLPAPALKKYEQKKISFVEDNSEKVIGDISTVGDYVSKRLLCCYTDTDRSPKFLNMVTGQFFNISNFLRPEPDAYPIGGEQETKTDETSGPPPKGKTGGLSLTPPKIQ